MELEDLGDGRFAIRVDGLEWTALTIPVFRTADRPHPRGTLRHEWPQWGSGGAPGRRDVVLQIRDADDKQSLPAGPVRLVLERDHGRALVEVLQQNRRVEWGSPLVPRELVTQMVAAVEAFLADAPLPAVETERISKEWLELEDREWGSSSWEITAGRLTEKRAKLAAMILRFLRIGNFSAKDPRQLWMAHLDYSTAVRLRAALQDSSSERVVDYGTGDWIDVTPAQAREEMRDLLDIDEFLGHAEIPGPEDYV